jgi:phage shock protein PspC (stress-responsive transcriptional regulator)
MIAGVCGGLGEYFNVDPVIARVIFVLLALINGIGLLAYLILWLIVPQRGKAELPPKDAIKEGLQDMRDQAERLSGRVKVGSGSERGLWLGIILIVIGVLFLISNISDLNLLSFLKYWPIVLIIAGIVLLLNRFMRVPSKPEDQS